MSKRLTVLSLVHNLFFGGDQTRLLSFAKTYDRERFHHLVASIHLPDEEYMSRFGSMREQFASEGVDVIELGKHHRSADRTSLRPDQIFATARSLLSVIRKLRRVIREHEVDIIDARLSSPIFVGGLTGRLYGIPCVGTTYSFEGKPSLLTKLVMQVAFCSNAVIITDSEIWRSRIEKAIRWPWTRVVNIPNGIFPPRIERSPDETRATLEIPNDPDTRVVCQVSRLVEYKGHVTLLDAASQVLAQYPNAFFLLVGHDESGDYESALNAKAQKLGISDRVRITGYTGTIGDVWNVVDIHAHASHLDSAPNAIIEGMSVGKPAVVTDVGGIPDLVGHGETGLVVPTRDAEALAKGICDYLENDSFAKQMGEAARKRYLERYTPEIMTGRHQDLFLELCDRQNK